MTVRELLGRIDSKELSEWQAYSMLEPFGEKPADYRMAILASVMANIFSSKDSKQYKPQDFVPEWGMETREQDWRDQLAMVDLIARK